MIPTPLQPQHAARPLAALRELDGATSAPGDDRYATALEVRLQRVYWDAAIEDPPNHDAVLDAAMECAEGRTLRDRICRRARG